MASLRNPYNGRPFDGNFRGRSLCFWENKIGRFDAGRLERSVDQHHSFKLKLNVINEANLTGGENIGGATAAPAAPEASGDDDDGGGDPDPEPERRRPGRPRKTRTTSPAANLPAPSAAADALIQFDTRPASSFVRLPVVCGLYACSPATAWRWVKAGKIPAPVKLSDRVTAWRVGDLRAALEQLAG